MRTLLPGDRVTFIDLSTYSGRFGKDDEMVRSLSGKTFYVQKIEYGQVYLKGSVEWSNGPGFLTRYSYCLEMFEGFTQTRLSESKVSDPTILFLRNRPTLIPIITT